MKRTIVFCFALMLGAASGQENKSSLSGDLLYQNDFEKAEVGKVPEEFMVLEGAFTVKEENSNRFLELPGAPLDSYGVLSARTRHRTSSFPRASMAAHKDDALRPLR